MPFNLVSRAALGGVEQRGQVALLKLSHRMAFLTDDMMGMAFARQRIGVAADAFLMNFPHRPTFGQQVQGPVNGHQPGSPVNLLGAGVDFSRAETDIRLGDDAQHGSAGLGELVAPGGKCLSQRIGSEHSKWKVTGGK